MCWWWDLVSTNHIFCPHSLHPFFLPNDATYQALFAGSIPEIIDIVKTFPKYNGTYYNYRGLRHVFQKNN